MGTTQTQRITIRGYKQGFRITSKNGGVFGTQIFVRHLSTALCIKDIMRKHPFGSDVRFAAIDALIKEDASR